MDKEEIQTKSEETTKVNTELENTQAPVVDNGASENSDASKTENVNDVEFTDTDKDETPKSEEKKPQDNSENARRRREAERQAELKKTRYEAIKEATDGVNPYTNDACPFGYTEISKYCNDSKIGVVLDDGGDLLIFKNHELVFAKRKGVWVSYCHDEIIQLLSNRTSHTMKEIRKAIYLTALDCSFSNTGGCIVYINKDKSQSALNYVDINDVISESHYYMKKEQPLVEASRHSPNEPIQDYTFEEFMAREACTKSNTLKTIINGKKFHELSRKFREEMVAMDGATIVDYDGTIIAAGAIVKIEAGSSGGGRLAATKTLAKYGVAIKISMDGMMQCYDYDKKTHKSKMLFSVG